MALAIADVPLPLATDAQGVVRIGGTRVTLDTVISAFLDGTTAEEIVQQYPSLHLGDVYAVISFYLHQQAEVDAYLHERRQRADEIRQQNETRFGLAGVRERLLARRSTERS